mgnify:CR=1 FL=1
MEKKLWNDELKMAEQYRGPVTEEKVDALLAQESRERKMPE